MRLEAFGATDVGRRREQNEDALLVDPSVGLFVVADGMGGHAAGEVAARLAVETVRAFVGARGGGLPAAPPEALRGALAELMRAALDEANRAVHDLGRKNALRRGAGTTCTALLVRGDQAVLGHVGDSRLYLWRDGSVNQLSHDHTFVGEAVRRGVLSVEQAREHPQGSLLLKAVGTQPRVEVDTLVFDVLPGDRLLLCSDGLHGYVDDPTELATLLSGDPAELPARLVALANERGGRDNITAVVVHVVPPAAETPELLRRRSEVHQAFDALRHIVLFADLTHAEVLGVMELLKTETHEAGALLVNEGDTSGALYVLASGHAEVLRGHQRLAELHAGSHFGEMALLTQRPRSASVRALSSCRLLVLDRDAFGRLLGTHPLIGVKFLWRLAQVQSLRLDDTNVLVSRTATELAGPATMPLGQLPAPFRRR